MKCPFCLEEIPDNSEKCELCKSDLFKQCPLCQEKIKINAIKCKHCGSMFDSTDQRQPTLTAAPLSLQPKLKSQTIATILCALVGTWGIHRFYIGPVWAGVAYLLLCWTGIPGLIALVETYIIAFSSQETWARKYNNGVITPPTHIAVKILAAILPILLVVGILGAVAIPQFNAYRIKAYNSAALSDLRNAKTNLEAYYANNNKYPNTLEATNFNASNNVNIKCSILPEAYVCATAHKKGTILYVADNIEAGIDQQPYSTGQVIQLPYEPKATGAVKADGDIAPQIPPPTPETVNVSPSFDCGKASTAAERLICSNSELAQADIQLAQAYKAALGDAADKAALKKEQAEWLKNQRDVCIDANAMLKVYQERTSQLSK